MDVIKEIADFCWGVDRHTIARTDSYKNRIVKKNVLEVDLRSSGSSRPLSKTHSYRSPLPTIDQSETKDVVEQSSQLIQSERDSLDSLHTNDSIRSGEDVFGYDIQVCFEDRLPYSRLLSFITVPCVLLAIECEVDMRSHSNQNIIRNLEKLGIGNIR